MNNVWFAITGGHDQVAEKCGFQDVRMVDEDVTTTDEQRKTEWMRNDFAQYLMPDDPTRTIEGYPAPKRAVLL